MLIYFECRLLAFYQSLLPQVSMHFEECEDEYSFLVPGPYAPLAEHVFHIDSHAHVRPAVLETGLGLHLIQDRTSSTSKLPKSQQGQHNAAAAAAAAAAVSEAAARRKVRIAISNMNVARCE